MKVYVCLVTVLVALTQIQCENNNNNNNGNKNQLFLQKSVNSNIITPISITESPVRRTFLAIANRKFQVNDATLLELLKREIAEATRMTRENPKLRLLTVTKKAQDFVSNITASYTQAIFSAKSPAEAKQILARFQNTIKMIVGFIQSFKLVKN